VDGVGSCIFRLAIVNIELGRSKNTIRLLQKSQKYMAQLQRDCSVERFEKGPIESPNKTLGTINLNYLKKSMQGL